MVIIVNLLSGQDICVPASLNSSNMAYLYRTRTIHKLYREDLSYRYIDRRSDLIKNI